MGLWDLYFITKLFLYFGQYMGFHAWPNLVFAIFLIAPIPEKLAPKRLPLYRQIIAVPVGISLFYYDTWLPPITRAFSQASAIEGFSGAYLLELVGRFFNPWVVAALLLVFVLYYFASRRFRISSVILIAMLAPMFSIGQGRPHDEATQANATTRGAYQAASAGLSGPPTNEALNAQLQAFYADEGQRSVSFPAPQKGAAPFDILVLQVCSLSWDDIDFTHQADNPLLKRFDVLFTNFSSAASYSGPAAIRLLRGSCGQPAQAQLYAAVPKKCELFDALDKAGFRPELAMNHDGHFGDFLRDVRVYGDLQAPQFSNAGLAPYLQSFDGSPVFEDFGVLSKWWQQRLKSPAPQVALFYNTISLHDGNFYAGHRGTSSQIYPSRLETLLKDLDRFLSVLQASGRRVVVVVIGEHGAAMRGDKLQIAGLREIPTPGISIVPVGVKLIGLPDHPGAKPLVIDRPTSYLALSQLLANFMAVSPFGNPKLTMEDYARDLPETGFVAENEDVIVMRRGAQYFMRSKGDQWVEYEAPPPLARRLNAGADAASAQ
jgi:cellulose synthase operon protein YhjU